MTVRTLLGLLVVIALATRYTPPPLSPLSINRVQLGMTRIQVEQLFPHPGHHERDLREHVGAWPGTLGFLNATWVEFDSLRDDARVVSISGVNLAFEGVDLCTESWGLQSPDPRPAGLRQKLGPPDEIEPTKFGPCWRYRRYHLSVYSAVDTPWDFELASLGPEK